MPWSHFPRLCAQLAWPTSLFTQHRGQGTPSPPVWLYQVAVTSLFLDRSFLPCSHKTQGNSCCALTLSQKFSLFSLHEPQAMLLPDVLLSSVQSQGSAGVLGWHKGWFLWPCCHIPAGKVLPHLSRVFKVSLSSARAKWAESVCPAPVRRESQERCHCCYHHRQQTNS